MTKPKWKQGETYKTLQELMDDLFGIEPKIVYFHHKAYAPGFLLGMPFVTVVRGVRYGYFKKAVRRA